MHKSLHFQLLKTRLTKGIRNSRLGGRRLGRCGLGWLYNFDILKVTPKRVLTNIIPTKYVNSTTCIATWIILDLNKMYLHRIEIGLTLKYMQSVTLLANIQIYYILIFYFDKIHLTSCFDLNILEHRQEDSQEKHVGSRAARKIGFLHGLIS